MPLLFTALVGIVVLLPLFAIVRFITKRHRSVARAPDLSDGRNYTCPQCGVEMLQGWVLLGKGANWSDRLKGKPGILSHIGNALPNTISMRFKPAANMGWRCPACQLLLLDHSKLVE